MNTPLNDQNKSWKVMFARYQAGEVCLYCHDNKLVVASAIQAMMS
jgi:hypothetical protein